MSWFPLRVRHPFHTGTPAARAAASAGQYAALAGTFEELSQAARRGARAIKFIFILIYEDGAWPAREQRDQLWQLFEVPAYVIWVDRQGRQLGWECEAFDGLHTAEGSGVNRPGFRLANGPCACGRPGARLLRAEEPQARRMTCTRAGAIPWRISSST